MKSAQLPVLTDESLRECGSRENPATSKEVRRKVIIERRRDDHSQSIRSAFQCAFLLLNLLIGIQFFLWVRYYETAGAGWKVPRPPGVEGWLPIASLMNLKAWILTGSLPDIHPAGVILLVAFLSISILFRKSFCSWLCPVGTISETLWQFGNRLFGRNFLLPRWLDLVLRSLKYLLLLLFVYAIGTMSVAAIRQFLDGPYGVVADVKMLNFFRQMSSTSAVVVSVLIVSSVFVKNFWCRYLCPYGALLGIVSWFSPLSIRRNSELCVNCGKCSTACPARIPVDDLEVVRSPECLGCYRCVAACPSKKAVEMALGKGRIVKPVWFALGISALFLGLVLAARISGNWHTELPDKTYLELVPSANRYSHP